MFALLMGVSMGVSMLAGRTNACMKHWQSVSHEDQWQECLVDYNLDLNANALGSRSCRDADVGWQGQMQRIGKDTQT